MEKKDVIIIVILVLVFVGAIAGAIIGTVHQNRKIRDWVESTDAYARMQENVKNSTEAAEDAKEALDELKEKENYYKTLYPDLFD